MRIKWLSVIRIVGLSFVLLYHFFIKYFPGGFLGVDLFFTLSGYLTTALLIDEFAEKQTIDLKGFFKRRFYRILPPLLLVIGIITPLAWLIRDDFLAGIGQQISATIGFMTNVYEILAGGGYENQFTPHLFLHTWTLAIEVQFYLIWAFLIWRLTRIVKNLGQLRAMIFLISGVLFLLSFLSMFVSSFFSPDFSSIYFSSWTHIFPFFSGSILATLIGIRQTTKSFQRLIHKWSLSKSLSIFSVGLAVEFILLFTFKFTSIWTYLVGFLLSTLTTSVMIYAARLLHEQTEKITEPAILGYLADISYGLYLFHWPFYIIFSELFNNLLATILTLTLSFLFASLSFYIIEPLLAGKTCRFLGKEFSLVQHHKLLCGLAGGLFLATLATCFFAPKLGSLEQQMLIDGLKQADTRMAQTKTFAEKGKASSYDVTDGVTIIGDSVTLHATEQLIEVIPDALVDAQGSRNTAQAYEILKTNIDSGTLMKNVVIATGTNIVYNYEEEVNKIIELLPNGYRLIFVTPYDGNYQAYANPVAEKQATYERQLAKKYDYISLADWNAVAKANPQLWINTDNIHFGGDSATKLEGATLFAQTIKNALTDVENGPVKQPE